MSITQQSTPDNGTAGTSQLELYETAMCCQTGVCGPTVDEQLLAVREDIRWAEKQGVSVTRHNLTSDPEAFVANPKVTGLMQAFGEQALPALLVDGEIHIHGRYPTRKELAAILPQKKTTNMPWTQESSSGCGCSSASGC
jgi:hypothetical protein